MDVQPWPLSYLASTYPFRAIDLNVYSLGQVREYLAEGELKKLADFSRSALRARLVELGVDGQIEILDAPPALRTLPPGLTDCDILRVDFYFAQDVDATGSGAVAVSLIAWQESPVRRNESGKLICKPRPAKNGPPWVVQAGPRLIIARSGAKPLEQSRAILLEFIDSKLVDAVATTNETANAALQRLIFGAN